VLSYNIVVGQGHNEHCNLTLDLLLYIDHQVLIDEIPEESYWLHLLVLPRVF
jgi:hypothetical protein